MSDTRILRLGDGAVLVECGPMRMFIEGFREGIPQPELCEHGAEIALARLSEVAAAHESFRKPWTQIAAPANPVPRAMWIAVRDVGDPDLTPMAAVAGAIADSVADYLEAHGLTRVMVNNGGDVALRLAKGERITIGIRPDVNRTEISHTLTVTGEMGVGGVCTSGLGGRSFTRGCASAAVVVAPRAAVADAAATAVGNAAYVESPRIIQAPACSLDPLTDLGDTPVTTHIRDLRENEVRRCIERGLRRAEALSDTGLILGAFVAVGKSFGISPGLVDISMPYMEKEKYANP